MTLSPLDSPLWSGLYASAWARARLDDPALIAAMIRVEVALAEACDACGAIPAGQGARIAAALAGAEASPEALAEGAARDGVPVPALLAVLRLRLEPEAADALHRGATSQDIVDTATVLCLRAFAGDLLARTDALLDRLAALAGAEAETVQLARTRTQGAAPTTFGATVALWGLGLAEARERAAEAAERVAVLSLHGAAGTDAALGEAAEPVRAAMAAALDLSVDPFPWHARRTRVAAFADSCAGLAGQAGRIGADLARLAATGAGEVRLAGGGSSAMPHKVNPVRAEAAQSLARFAAHLQAAVSEAAIHAAQRDGAAWGLEWLALRPLCGAAAAAQDAVIAALADLAPDRAAMARNLAAAGAAPFSERIAGLLAERLGAAEARRETTRALAAPDPVAALTAAHPDIDWAAATDPLAAAGAAPRQARAFAESRRRPDA